MGVAERLAKEQDARAKKRDRNERRQENRAIDAELQRQAMLGDNVPGETAEDKRARAEAAVAKKTQEKKKEDEERRTARCARFVQRKDSRRTKHAPSDDD
jgi:hypothetical protein